MVSKGIVAGQQENQLWRENRTQTKALSNIYGPWSLPLAALLVLALTACQGPSKPAARPADAIGSAPGLLPLAAAAEGAVLNEKGRVLAEGRQVAVSTQGSAATAAARDILAAGGNLTDAAIAASLVISVERPHSTGLGGGGFWLYREARTGKVYALDFRERAPLRSFDSMFLDAQGKPDPNKSRRGALAVGVPGLVAGLAEVHRRWGRLPWDQLFGPAIRLAEEGVPIYPSLHRALLQKREELKLDPEAQRIFLRGAGEVPALGSLLAQGDLAKTLRRIAKQGPKVLYNGALGARLAFNNQSKGGLLRLQDFKSYRVIEREPVRGNFQGLEIWSMPPPSSGGTHVLQILKTLENFPLANWGPADWRSLHLWAAASQMAFADRARYLGDPDFNKIPSKQLISPEYLSLRSKEISFERARKSSEVREGNLSTSESTETTHLSLMDAEGNAIATTQTINGFFGALYVVPGTGIVMNNEMDDFTAKVGDSNLFGAVGGPLNLVEPRKTPLSSMSPTIVTRGRETLMSLGAPGGTRIITCVSRTLLNRWVHQRSLLEAVAAMRVHHQWQPDLLTMDPPGPGAETVRKLESLGYTVEIKEVPCSLMAVERDRDLLRAVSEPRDAGHAWAQ